MLTQITEQERLIVTVDLKAPCNGNLTSYHEPKRKNDARKHTDWKNQPNQSCVSKVCPDTACMSSCWMKEWMNHIHTNRLETNMRRVCVVPPRASSDASVVFNIKSQSLWTLNFLPCCSVESSALLMFLHSFIEGFSFNLSPISCYETVNGQNGEKRTPGN